MIYLTTMLIAAAMLLISTIAADAWSNRLAITACTVISILLMGAIHDKYHQLTAIERQQRSLLRHEVKQFDREQKIRTHQLAERMAINIQYEEQR